MSFNDHLDSDEKIILKFRQARRYYIGEYLFFIFIMLLSFGFLFTTYLSVLKSNVIFYNILTILFYIFMVISIILLIRVEYKIFFKSYALTTERILISEGIFTENFRSTSYSKITDIDLKQSFFDKLLNTGDIHIATAGTEGADLQFSHISKPVFIKKNIYDLQSINLQKVSSEQNLINQSQNNSFVSNSNGSNHQHAKNHTHNHLHKHLIHNHNNSHNNHNLNHIKK